MHQGIPTGKKDFGLFSVSHLLIIVLARDSRKIFRLFKSLNEFNQIYSKIYGDIIWQQRKLPHVLDFFSRLGFFFYWIFDNIQILANIKFINADPQFHLKLASWGWTIGILFGIARNVLDLLDLLKKKQAESALGEKEKKQETSQLDFLILKTLVDISGKLGDLIVASNGAGIAQKLFGKSFSEGTLAIGGLYAALVSLWNHYLK